MTGGRGQLFGCDRLKAQSASAGYTPATKMSIDAATLRAFASVCASNSRARAHRASSGMIG